jgi:hypothetical protein
MVAMSNTPSHMVNGAHLDGVEGAIVDNNHPGYWEWAPRRLYLDTWKAGNYGWAVAFLAPPPPPGEDVVPLKPRPAPSPRPDPLVIPKPKPSPCPGPGPCPVPRPKTPDRPAGEPYWVRVDFANGPTVWKLFDADGRFLGAYDAAGWHPAAGRDSWLARPQGEPPVPPPPEARPAGELGPDPADVAGVVADKIDATRWRYWVSGREVTRAEAFAAVGGEKVGVPDDSDRYHLTVASGPDSIFSRGMLRQLVDQRVADRGPALAAELARVHLQVYGPDDWPVRTGRVTPGVTLQRPAKDGGRVVYHSDDPDEDLAEVVKYLDPNYTPPPAVAPPPRERPAVVIPPADPWDDQFEPQMRAKELAQEEARRREEADRARQQKQQPAGPGPGTDRPADQADQAGPAAPPRPPGSLADEVLALAVVAGLIYYGSRG